MKKPSQTSLEAIGDILSAMPQIGMSNASKVIPKQAAKPALENWYLPTQELIDFFNKEHKSK